MGDSMDVMTRAILLGMLDELNNTIEWVEQNMAIVVGEPAKPLSEEKPHPNVSVLTFPVFGVEGAKQVSYPPLEPLYGLQNKWYDRMAALGVIVGNS